MKKQLLTCFTIVIVLLIGIVSYLYFFAPSADQLRTGVMTADDKTIDAAIVKETNAHYGDTAFLVAQKDSYYEFGMGQTNEGGGIELIAYRNEKGNFEVIWTGQDYPHCSALEKYSVPVGIVDHCFSGTEDDLKTIDRSNWVRSVLSRYWP